MRIAVASVTLCLSCLLAAQPSTEHAARFRMTQGIPLIEVRIDGQGPFSFVIDTGTNCQAIVSPRLAKRLGLSATGHKSITDLGGRDAHVLDAVELGTLSLAGADFHAIQAVVADLPGGDSVLDGVLGFGLFRNELLTLDYPRHRLILEKGSLAGISDEHVVPMRMPSGVPMLEVGIADSKMEAGIDSGGLGLSIPASMIGKFRFIGDIETVAFGRTQVSSFALRGAVLDGAAELAGFRFEQPWLEINPLFDVANIGSGALSDFIVTFDQRSKLVRFTSADKPHRLVKPKNRTISSDLDDLVGTVAVTETY
ncbi:MAG: aspartyl protease family protein [Terracidiphilus sp.]